METGEFNVHGQLSIPPDKLHPPATAMVDLTPGSTDQDGQLNRQYPHMQALWDKAVSKELKTPYKYRSVAVLIVRWADYLDRDLQCAEEVEDLNTLFSRRFNFQSSILTLDNKRNPRLQLRNGIDNLVLNYDGPCRSNLLIVYYTGHGVAREEDGGLEITGVPESGVYAAKFDARANWNDAEDSLNHAEADVLTILDCCCAGSIMKGSERSTDNIRSFEVLAATGREMPTERPGKRSFTRAMISALRDQLDTPEQAPFTTFTLNEEIMRRRNNNHRSHLFSRHPSNGHRFIKLAPLQPNDTTESPTSAQEASYLTVRFSFKDATILKSDQVVRLAKEVSQSAADSNLGINRIDWIDFRQNKNGQRWADFVHSYQMVRRCARRWRFLTRRRIQERSKRDLTENTDWEESSNPRQSKLSPGESFHPPQARLVPPEVHQIASNVVRHWRPLAGKPVAEEPSDTQRLIRTEQLIRWSLDRWRALLQRRSESYLLSTLSTEATARIPPTSLRLELAEGTQAYSMHSLPRWGALSQSAFTSTVYHTDYSGVTSLGQRHSKSVTGVSTLPTTVDSGIAMEFQKGQDLAQEEFDIDAESVVTDNIESTMPSDVKGRLESDFASSLVHRLAPYSQQRDRARCAVPLIPELLQDFAMLIRVRAKPGEQKDASVFVRHSRRRITGHVRRMLEEEEQGDALPLEPDPSAMTVNEKFSRWSTDLTSQPQEGQSDTRDNMDVDLLDDDEEPFYPLVSFPEARKFLLESDEYEWLLHQINLAIAMDCTGTAFLQTRKTILATLKGLYSQHDENPDKISLSFDWDPLDFMRDQFGESAAATSIGSVISYSGGSEDAYAATCEDHVSRMWPSIGSDILTCLDLAIGSPDRRARGAVAGRQVNMDVGADSGLTSVTFTGELLFAVQVAEAVTWLCLACRASDMGQRPALCRPIVTVRQTATGTTLCVTTASTIVPTATHTAAMCWHSMVRDPVIVMGYPIPRREHSERGLELSLGMMAMLSTARWAVSFAGQLMLKGYNAVVAPVKRVGTSVLWHCVIDKDGHRVPYQKGRELSVLTDFAEAFVAGGRHFVGWTESAEFTTGTSAANYDHIHWSRYTEPVGPGAYLESALSISGGKYITVGLKVARGRKDTPEYLAEGKYTQMIDRATRWRVVLSDTAEKRHWLTDGASALLHLCRSWLSPEHTRDPPKNVAESIKYASDSFGADVAYQTLIDNDNRTLRLGVAGVEVKSKASTSDTTAGPPSEYTASWWCLQELVEQFWRMLEQIHDGTELRRQPPGNGLDLDLRSLVLTGFNFKDIVRGDSPIEPLNLKLSEGATDWYALAKKLGTINLMGSNFGELVKPHQSPRTHGCAQWASLSAGHDFLAVPMYVLKSIVEKCWEHTTDSVKIMDGMYWTGVTSNFRLCQCPSGRCTTIVRKLHTKASDGGSTTTSRHAIFASHPRGAIILGHIPGKLTKLISSGHGEESRKRKAAHEVDAPQRHLKPEPSDSGIDVKTPELSSSASQSSLERPHEGGHRFDGTAPLGQRPNKLRKAPPSSGS